MCWNVLISCFIVFFCFGEWGVDRLCLILSVFSSCFVVLVIKLELLLVFMIFGMFYVKRYLCKVSVIVEVCGVLVMRMSVWWE